MAILETVPLSIIIPTLNEQGVIEACLDHLQPLRKMGVEIIVSDGGSIDRTCELAAAYADKVISGESGRSCQMNAGAGIARGQYFLFLHADTQLPEHFSVALLLGAQWGFFPLRLSGSAWPFRFIEHAINLRSKISGIGTGDQVLFVRSALFNVLGGFADIPLMEDVEFCRRLKVICRPAFGHSFVVTSSRRWEQRGIIRTVFQMWRLRLAYFLGVSPQSLVRQYYS